MKQLIHNIPKKVKYLYIAELIVLLCCIIVLLIPGNRYQLLKDNNFSETVNLSFGRYMVSVEYEYQDAQMTISPVQKNAKWYSGSVLSEVQNVFGSNQKINNVHEFELWVTGINSDVGLDITDNSSITSITISETPYAKICVLLLVILSIAATITLRWIISRELLTRENVIIAIALTGIIIVSSMPIFTQYALVCFDTVFHMVRVEGIKDGLLAGQFPVKVEPTFLNGYGYAVSTYYGSLFLYIPAVLRILGFTLQFSYKVLLLIINSITVIGSYSLFKKMTANKKWGIAGSIIYSLSVYRFMDAYYRGALGETIAMALIPIIALGLWNIYTKPYDEKYSRRWILLCLGYTGLIQSHVLSTEIVAAVCVLICLILWKKTFTKDTILVLIKFFVMTVLLNLGFLVPFLDGLINFKMNINAWEDIQLYIQSTGVSLDNLFSFQIPQKGGMDYTTHVYNFGAGLALGLGGLISFFIIFTGVVRDKKAVKEYIFWGVFAIATTVMATIYFPWDRILMFSFVRLGALGRLIVNLITSIQFTFRLLAVVTFFVTAFIVIAAKLFSKKNMRLAVGIITVISAITLIQNVILNSAITMIATQTQVKLNFINSSDVSHNCYVINGEYLPILDNCEGMSGLTYYVSNYIEENLTVSEYSKEYTNVRLKVTNPSDTMGKIELPLIYYPGYVAVDEHTGEKINIERSSLGRLQINVESGKEYDVHVYYYGKLIWKIAEIISIISFVYIILTIMNLTNVKRRRKKAYAFKDAEGE